jgi:hypothetical protein
VSTPEPPIPVVLSIDVDLTPLKLSKDDSKCSDFLADKTVQGKLASAKYLADIKEEDYDVIFYVGGHGPVIDLAPDEGNAKVASAVCTTLNHCWEELDTDHSLEVLASWKDSCSCLSWSCVSANSSLSEVLSRKNKRLTLYILQCAHQDRRCSRQIRLLRKALHRFL